MRSTVSGCLNLSFSCICLPFIPFDLISANKAFIRTGHMLEVIVTLHYQWTEVDSICGIITSWAGSWGAVSRTLQRVWTEMDLTLWVQQHSVNIERVYRCQLCAKLSQGVSESCCIVCVCVGRQRGCVLMGVTHPCVPLDHKCLVC